MSEREKQIRFLKALARREPSNEVLTLQEQIHLAECKERGVKRVIFLVFVLMLLSLCTMGYGWLFNPQYLRDASHLALKIPCSVGLASVICLLTFTVYWLWHRAILNSLYAQCRQLLIDK